jgi:hypothetical protein
LDCRIDRGTEKKTGNKRRRTVGILGLRAGDELEIASFFVGEDIK